MPIIAIGIVNKQGKIILSRQFSDVSRSRVEGLLSAFPRLLEATKSASRQATYLDAGTTRYIYMPLDEMNNLYLTLLNDRKTSNIVEDLATLNLVGRIIPEYLRGGVRRGGGGGGGDALADMGAEDEEYDDYDFMYDLEVMFAEVAGDEAALYEDGAASNDGNNADNAASRSATMEEQLGKFSLDIFFALDEIVTEGKRDQVTLEQVQTYLDMDSHAERVYLEAKRKREEEAKRISSQHAKTIAEQRRRHMLPQGGSYGGIGSDDFNSGRAGGGGGGGNYYPSSSDYTTTTNNNNNYAAPSASSYSSPPPSGQAAAPRSGMSLGKASLNKKTDILSKVQQEMGVPAPPPAGAAPAVSPNAMLDPRGGAQQQQQQPQKAIMISIEEKMSCHISKEGDASPVDVKGELSLLVNDPASTKLKIALQSHLSPSFQFKCHARMNKNLFAENHVLSMAENKPFPVQQPITIMRWKLENNSNVAAPITFTCWPEEESKSITIEYELADNNNNALDDVVLFIPLHHYFGGSGAEDLTVTPSCGEYDVVAPNSQDAQFKCIRWHIPLMTSHMNKEGNIEIQLQSDTTNNNNSESETLYFPIQVQFSSRATLGQVNVREVVNSDNGKGVEFGVSTSLTAEHFEIS